MSGSPLPRSSSLAVVEELSSEGNMNAMKEEQINAAFTLDDESDYYSGSPDTSDQQEDQKTSPYTYQGPSMFSFSRELSLRSRASTVKADVSATSTKAAKKIGSRQKWRELTMGTSFVYAICLTIVYLALLISDNLPAETVDATTVLTFLIVMFATSLVALTYLLTLCALGKLTNDEHYKKRGKSTFIRGGMLVLGTGMIIYSSLTVATYMSAESQCRQPLVLVACIFSILFTVGQIAFLLIYNKIRINRTLVLSISGRYLMMQVIATNLCVWLGAVFHETVEEIMTQNDQPHSESFYDSDSVFGSVHDALQYSDTYFEAIDLAEGYSTSHGSDLNSTCSNVTDLQIARILTPYLFPLMIEFCVVASCMCLAVWENCGNGWMPMITDTGDASSLHQPATMSPASIETAYTASKPPGHTDKTTHSPSNYFNNNVGFVLGWMLIVSSLVIIVLVLYYLYSEVNEDIRESMMYGLNLALSAVALVSVPPTMYSMSKLTFKDDEIRALRVQNHIMNSNANIPTSYKGIHRRTDKNLLFNTYIAMMTFKLFVMIAAYEMNEPVIFVDGIVSIISGFWQTLFINWYAFQKRSTTEEDRHTKPGRQGLEFLRCSNFALWLVNTFLLKNQKAKRVMYETFGNDAWAILSNIFQPLTILYYFHSMVCIAEVISRTYTAKYVGVTRPWKRPKVRSQKLKASTKVSYPINSTDSQYTVF